MDPLSVTASIVGILAASGKLSELLRSIISTAKDAPQVVTQLGCEINEVRAALSSLQTLLTDLSSAPPSRAALIQLDQLIVILTESVLTFSELEAIVSPLAASPGKKFSLINRLKWTRAEGNCLKMVERLQRHKASISLMLNILQCASDAEAGRSQESLEYMVEQLLESNQELCKRLKNLEDAFDARSTISKKFDDSSLISREDNETITTARPSNNARTSIIEAVRLRFAFDDDLESSRVYRMVRNDYCDRSFVSSAVRTNAWSIFSGITLADISIISVVALPLYPRDIVNREHYSFGDTEASQPSEPAGLWTNKQLVIELEAPQPKGVLSADTSTRLGERAEHANERDAPMTPRPPQAAEALPSLSLAMRGAIPSFQDGIHSSLSQRDTSGRPVGSPSGTRMNAAPQKEAWASSLAHPNFDGAEIAGSTSIHDKDDASSLVYGDGLSDDDDDDDDVVYPCKGCGEIMEEGKAFELGGKRWHIDCFRCDSCGTLLDSDANLLLLGDGSLICNNCTYSCNSCGNKIEELAILTGDQAYCRNCFICQGCKGRIENLRYARTSQGMFCMTCHESLMARRRKKARERQNHPVLDLSLPALPAQQAFDQKESLEQAIRESLLAEKNFRIHRSRYGLMLVPDEAGPGLRPPFFCTTCGSVADSAANFIKLVDGAYVCNRAKCIPGTGIAF
ncbi:hypothetical protein DM02DRAFT_649288 [Periconia macrospinosa]|uniref:LIM zinc-binding domain-containing protein n=1 Tax=Periconia macrospinosa TaxID=97972 RepID=A0A2V1E990_9PLEO|nr:hypothetical protein DM02DRAFT_649288 [Periconia macrospinosa]